MNIYAPPKERIAFFEQNLKIPIDVWDPLGTFNPKVIQTNVAKLEASFEMLKNNPQIIKKTINSATYFGIGFGIFFLIFFFFTFITHFLFFAIAVFILLRYLAMAFIRSISTDLIKLSLAKKYGWVYDPQYDLTRTKIFVQKIPEIFNKGNRSQQVEDQFWGTYQHIPFNTGLFEYTIKSGKNSRTVKNHYFAIKLPSKVKARFHLYKEGVFSKLGNLFTDKEINTESIEFNKTFAFSYNGKKDEKALHIVSTLTPAVQERLLEMYKKNDLLEVLFVDDTVFFLFDGVLLPKIKTDFRKSLNLADEDSRELEAKLQQVLIVAKEMTKAI